MLKAKLFTGRIQLAIKLESPFLIKSSGGVGLSPQSPDMECIRTMRNGESQVYIPGTSFKGVIRSYAERLVATHDIAMFGHTSNAGLFHFADAYASADNPPVVTIRSNTKIDPKTGGAARNSLRSFEVVESGTFTTYIDWVNISLSQLGLLLLVLNEFNERMITLGSGGSKGMGAVNIHIHSLTLKYPACIIRENSLYSYTNSRSLDMHQIHGFTSLSDTRSTDSVAIQNLQYHPIPNGLGVQIYTTNPQQIVDIRTTCLDQIVNEMRGNNV